MGSDQKGIFSHPEVEDVLKKSFSYLVPESDRGATLVGAEIINSQVRKLFESKTTRSKTLIRKLLEYPGSLSSFSARLDVAYAVNYIDKNLYSSIKILKDIRNNAAHSKSEFNLSSQKEKLKKILELGPNIPISISNLAYKYLVHYMADGLWENRQENLLEESLFDSKEEIYDYLAQSEDAINRLNELHPKIMLSFAIALITGLLISYREGGLK